MLKSKKESSIKFDITNEFTFSKELELTCNENGFQNIKHTEKSVPVTLGDWSCLVGNDYSGSGIYETEFTLPAEKIGKEGEIDLGDVRFAACVSINGYRLGTALTPPFRLQIPEGILKEKNMFEIVVTNTSANWYVYTDYFSRRNTKELSPYFEAELNYAKDLVSGVLYGPVVLYTE